MKVVRVNLKENSYDILVGCNILCRLGKIVRSLGVGRNAVVITNRVVRGLYGKELMRSLYAQGIGVHFIEVADSEKSKSALTAFDVIHKIAALDVNKPLFIIALGGGVIGDLAGFVAAVYKRGVPFIQVPTTLLAQIDSAIGGKVAIDLPIAKNLVGAFYQPKLVLADVTVLKTLSLRQIRNGLAEAIKYGMIKDKKLFDQIAFHLPELLAVDLKQMSSVVMRCSRIKADIVSRDEKEKKGLRTILNFGHTIGHAIESAGQYNRWQHGEAVSLGMRVACSMAVRKKIFSLKSAQRLENLLDRVGLPKKIHSVSLSRLMKAVRHDKKKISPKNRMVLPISIGRVKVVEGILAEEIRRAVIAYAR